MKYLIIVLATVFITVNVVAIAAIFLIDYADQRTAEGDLFDEAWLFSDEWDDQ